MTGSAVFLTLLRPDIDAARARVRDGLARLASAQAQPQLPDPPVLEAMLFDGVRGALERLVTPTLVLELNVARLRGELQGDSPEARFAGYVARLDDAGYVAALRTEYPPLFALAAARLDRWVVVALELVDRLYRDWPTLRDTLFAGQSPGPLTGVRMAQRTTKRGGRAVAILSFASGDRLVYKPRSLAIEEHFQQLLRWLNERGFEPAFKSISLIDRGLYGWMAWVGAEATSADESVARFYRRQGAYLALLYALEATDFHLSNIIAAGEHPLLIDLEALFHPRDADPPWPPLDVALDALTYHSVLRIGLLPEPEAAGEGRFDMGGLTGAAGQLTPYTVPRWQDQGTDAMRLVREPRRLGGGQNRPILAGRPVDALDYLDALDEGFTAAYRLLVDHRKALLAEDGPLARFADDEVRVLPRSGQQYGEWLDNSYHPDLLRQPGARASYFERRLREDSDEPGMAALVPYETAALLAGDIPLFVTRAGSRAVRSYEGDELAGFFPLSGLEMSRQRILSLSEEDLAQQRQFIRAAFATVAGDEPGQPRPLVVPAAAPADLASRMMDAATAIGSTLAAMAVRAGDEASWVGVELDDVGHWSLEPLDADFYNGLPGVALFLAHLGAQTGAARWTALARAAVATWRRLAEESRADDPDALAPLGLFDGLGGQLYVMAQLITLWGEAPDLHAEIGALLDEARAALDDTEDSEAPGLACGLAGLLAGLLAIHAVAPRQGALLVAQAAGRRLRPALQTTAPAEASGVFDRRALFPAYLGGPAGAAGPLLELAALTGDEALQAEAARLLSQATADPGADLWPAYLSARPWLPPAVRSAFDAALAEAMPSLLAQRPDNHSLGRGVLGYLDLARSAADALDDAALRDRVARHAAGVLADIDRGPRTGAPLAVPAPGLMAGLAGIGYGLLRLAAPAAVPSILLPAAARRFA